ncbi:Clp protease N-terminal domain-containing protein [Longispora albida]|uniref:Clp protease N-terminal domain-containing protein n=1 Tax=Longispora albida TaxID=203523 RepID=UPI000360E130|nr:Clp protease N-terminal domain-containing protein [Longispora albida]
MFERFTDRARTAVKQAQAEATQLGHSYVGTEHLLLALLAGDGIASRVLRDAGLTHETARTALAEALASAPLGPEDAAALRSVGIDLDAVLASIEQNFGPEALAPPPQAPRRGLFGRKGSGGRFTARAKKVLELSLREAIRLKHNYIGTEHILLGLIREGEGLGARILTSSGADLSALRSATEQAIPRAA